MTAINGHASGSAFRHADRSSEPAPLADNPTAAGTHFAPEKVKEIVAALEVPFDQFAIEWRVTNTTQANGTRRGQVIPYADQRAYTDRLNALFTPAGWTRKYTVHSSANFQRSADEKIVAKVFVTCDLTIFGLGCHAATGEEWADNENAGTAAEAQAFKRACSCFGLGRYLYYFSGIWMDLDERKRPKTTPQLVGWATPEGWRKGLRPLQVSSQDPKNRRCEGREDNSAAKVQQANREDLIRQIEGMAACLGKAMYRGLLKTLARAWNPADIRDPQVIKRVLVHMESAARGFQRLQVALDRTGEPALGEVLDSLHVRSLDRVNSLETLKQIVLALEAKARNKAHL
jgi:hypothetical protein